MSTASRAGIGLAKFPGGLGDIFKGAAAFCEAHANLVKHLLEPAGDSNATTAPNNMQMTVSKREPADCEGGAPVKGMGGHRHGKAVAKPIVEVHP